MPKYRQYLLRLNPDDPEDRVLITSLDEAGNEWGGVQRLLKEAVAQRALAAAPAASVTVEVAEEASPPASLIAALKAVMPDAAPHAAQALAASEPMRKVRALYAALDGFSPDALTETEALLLRELQRRIEALLHEAADRRQPIRQILAPQEKEA